MLCEKCKKRDQCSELCSDAEAFIDQDQVFWDDPPINPYTAPQTGELRVFDEKTGKDRAFLTPTEKKILRSLLGSVHYDKLARETGVSKDNLYKHMSRLKKKEIVIEDLGENEPTL